MSDQEQQQPDVQQGTATEAPPHAADSAVTPSDAAGITSARAAQRAERRRRNDAQADARTQADADYRERHGRS